MMGSPRSGVAPQSLTARKEWPEAVVLVRCPGDELALVGIDIRCRAESHPHTHFSPQIVYGKCRIYCVSVMLAG